MIEGKMIAMGIRRFPSFMYFEDGLYDGSLDSRRGFSERRCLARDSSEIAGGLLLPEDLLSSLRSGGMLFSSAVTNTLRSLENEKRATLASGGAFVCKWSGGLERGVQL